MHTLLISLNHAGLDNEQRPLSPVGEPPATDIGLLVKWNLKGYDQIGFRVGTIVCTQSLLRGSRGLWSSHSSLFETALGSVGGRDGTFRSSERRNLRVSPVEGRGD